MISILYVLYTQIAHGHFVCDINACYCLRGVSHRRVAELLRTNQALVCSLFLCTCIARQYPIPFLWGTFPLIPLKKKRCPEILPIVHMPLFAHLESFR